MRRRIHVTDGINEYAGYTAGPEEGTMEENLSQEATGTNAPSADDLDGLNGGNDSAGSTSADTDADADADAQQAEIDSLHAKLEQLTRERDEEKNQHLRTLADFQNFRRRKEEERSADRQFANRELVLAMLPALDNFERALTASQKTQSYDALIDGVKLTLRQLNDFLTKNGVKLIESVGAEFNPNLHEAVMRVEDSDQPENTVVEELQKGYTMHDRVLRPSMVKVARSE